MGLSGRHRPGGHRSWSSPQDYWGNRDLSEAPRDGWESGKGDGRESGKEGRPGTGRRGRRWESVGRLSKQKSLLHLAGLRGAASIPWGVPVTPAIQGSQAQPLHPGVPLCAVGVTQQQSSDRCFPMPPNHVVTRMGCHCPEKGEAPD